MYADCGDSLRGSQTVYHRREPIIAELDAAHVDVQAMGNREFHYLFGAVRARAAQMQHPFICANLVDTRGRALPFTTDVVLRREEPSTGSGGATRGRCGSSACWSCSIRPARRGNASSAGAFSTPSRWRRGSPPTTPPDTTLIALSHLGLKHDRILAQRVPRLELILGGHSHDTLFEPDVVAGVPIVHAGPYGTYASRTELAKDANGRARIADFALEPLA